MNILDGFQDLVAAVIRQLGLLAVAPGFVAGLILVVVAIVIFRKSDGKSGIGVRIAAGVAITLGLPLLLASIGVGATDALIWSIIALAASGIWLIGAKGKVVTIVGILVVVIAFGGLITVTQSNPSGSIMAENLQLLAGRGQSLWNATILWAQGGAQ